MFSLKISDQAITRAKHHLLFGVWLKHNAIVSSIPNDCGTIFDDIKLNCTRKDFVLFLLKMHALYCTILWNVIGWNTNYPILDEILVESFAMGSFRIVPVNSFPKIADSKGFTILLFLTIFLAV